ncbi:hypothetical protein AB0M39_22890 [Streptomyces sp. NPDC051907]|uniref:hypothetical protein n=1 Tax=Streptomyces sp. NPDC051907 TaxID=3155284 RepID=UPI0034384617
MTPSSPGVDPPAGAVLLGGLGAYRALVPPGRTVLSRGIEERAGGGELVAAARALQRYGRRSGPEHAAGRALMTDLTRGMA